ncbi:MAG: MFS transporter, partial [Microlunatus sp.]|nr:MFS transporter [Microlunatus sp.]
MSSEPSEETAAATGAVADVDAKTLRKAVAASALGNATEWFDYGIYAYGVTYISAALFPGNAAQATLLALATFAISFLVRPLGGLVWGPLGDRLGRKTILSMTIILMSVATFLVGLIPSHDSIGIWATVIVILLRMIQGFSTGGEYGGAATFMAEYAPDKRRGFFGSFLEFGTITGFSFGALLMLGTSLVVGTEAMGAWGWRLPFFVALPLGLIGLYLRNRMEDTPVFRDLEEQGAAESQATTALKDLIVGYWKPLLLLGGLVIALNVCNYTLLSYMPTYLEGEIGLSSNGSLLIPIIGQLIMLIFIPIAGGLSDRVGR